MRTSIIRLGRAIYRRWLAARYSRVLTSTAPGVVIEGPLAIRNEGVIRLGPRCRLRATRWAPITLEAMGGATISIGAHSFINRGVLIGARQSVTIGDGAIIADRCIIYDTDWHTQPGTAENVPIPTAPVVIGAHAWIGASAIILKGVSIGDYAVVGAGSVVTHSLPAHCLAAGNPARVIREGRTHDIVRP